MDLSEHFKNQDFLRELVERAEKGDDEAAKMLRSVFTSTIITLSPRAIGYIGRAVLNGINTLLRKDLESN